MQKDRETCARGPGVSVRLVDEKAFKKEKVRYPFDDETCKHTTLKG